MDKANIFHAYVTEQNRTDAQTDTLINYNKVRNKITDIGKREGE